MLSKACQNRPATHFWVATLQSRTAAVERITIIASSLMADRWMALSKCHFWLQVFLFFPFHLSILPSPRRSPRLFSCPHLTLGRLASLPPSLLCLFPFLFCCCHPLRTTRLKEVIRGMDGCRVALKKNKRRQKTASCGELLIGYHSAEKALARQRSVTH